MKPLKYHMVMIPGLWVNDNRGPNTG